MDSVLILRELGTIVVFAAAAGMAARALRVPPLVAYMVAGIVLGPVLGVITLTPDIELIASAGIALLLFLVGLELSFDRIRDVGAVAVTAGLGQVAFTAIGGTLVCLALGFSATESIFIAVALTFSSTVVVVKLLDQKAELNSLYGRIAVGIFLVQDLVVITVLTLLAGWGAGEAAGTGSILAGIIRATVGMITLLSLALIAARYLLPRLFSGVAASVEALLILSLCWCFLLVLVAEAFGLSLEIGAFLAGITLAQLPFTHALRVRIHPLVNFFIAIFFASLGIRMDVGIAQMDVLAALVLSAFVLIGNPLIFMWIISRMGYSERTSFATSVTVAQISEFSFIFAAMGMEFGLVDEAVLALVAFIGVVTISISAYMILYSQQLYDFMRRRNLLRIFRAGQEPEEEPADQRRGHIIVVGMNTLGRMLVNSLSERGEQVLAIDTDAGKLAGLPCATQVGDTQHPAVLREADFTTSLLLVSALQIEAANNLLAYRCREAGVPCAIHVFDPSVSDQLRRLGVDYLMDSKHDGIRQVAEELRRAGVVT